MKTFRAKIVTPEACVFDDAVESLVAPGTDGFFGVLADHAPMIAGLAAGVLKVSAGGADLFFRVGGGVLDVSPGAVLLLTDSAVRSQAGSGETGDPARRAA